MPLDFTRARPLLQNGDLAKLFVEELGWEPCHQKLTLRAGERDFAFTSIAEKRGFTAWLHECPDGRLPDHATRIKLDRALAQTSFEHLIVFAADNRCRQSWMWVRRQPGRPLSARTHDYTRGQPGDSLLQKLQHLFVSLDEEEAGLSVVEVAGRVRAAFDLERVTKAFYRDFDTHRKAFLKFIEGIVEVAHREWYASVMLNRLMFVYFIQRKGFLDGDPKYLRNRLQRCKQQQGKDKFYTFYRYFLLRLFHEGFGKRRKDRAPDLEKLLGNIPYLNGGLFDVHELEKPDRYGKDIQIPDKAFERVFDYFDQYQWHLDERPLRADNEINPDVLGYIFEKYINQKQMGAYYTKEDITEYISKNCVIPFLFDAAHTRCKVAFENPNGPGAFIFAALNILEPLYEACLDRMEAFLAEWGEAGKKLHPNYHRKFTEVLARVASHPNRRYFVLKSIVLNNLYAVDIMDEAVEICKLRLFLKLVAQVEPDAARDNLGIEPLPDIDFNIRAGNTLVGYASADEVRKCMTEFGSGQMRLGVEDELQSFTRFTDKLQIADAAFRSFRQQQTELGGSVTPKDKAELRAKLKALEDELNRYLAHEYGVKVSDKTAYAKWVNSHQPFHWFVEFYGIMSNGGFDVIIGNPPYVVNTPEKVSYEIKEALFKTYACKNLYALICERSLQLAHKNTSLGMIVQLTALSSEKMPALQNLLLERGLLVAPSFPRRPESIFDGVEMPVTILISRSQKFGMSTSRISRFYTEERPHALNVMVLAKHDTRLHGHRLGKIGTGLEVDVFRKLDASPLHLELLTTASSDHILYYQEACRYWAKVCKGYPFFKRNGERMPPPHGRTVFFTSREACAFAACLVNTGLFYWFYSAFSDCEHINDALLRTFKIPGSWSKEDWIAIEACLANDLKQHSNRKTISTKQGHKIEYDELDASKSKPIIDEIDTVLAGHYGFTVEELDFILNYDIKYRLGRDAGEESE